MLGLEKRLVRLESRLASLHMAHNNLVGGKIQKLCDLVDTDGTSIRSLRMQVDKLVSDLAEVQKGLNIKPRRRVRKTWDLWREVQKKLERGLSIREASIELKMAYSTAWYYAQMTEAEAKALPTLESLRRSGAHFKMPPCLAEATAPAPSRFAETETGAVALEDGYANDFDSLDEDDEADEGFEDEDLLPGEDAEEEEDAEDEDDEDVVVVNQSNSKRMNPREKE